MITLKNITLRRGIKVVLQDANLVLNSGEKVGLVGANGAGKSSLFSLLTNRLGADAGESSIPAKWLISEVAQEMPDTDESATDFVLQGDTLLMRAQAQLQQAQNIDDGHAMALAHQAIQDANGFDARPRAQSMLQGLGFLSNQLEAPVNTFSGGWRMRLQLARALMCSADLLLLDEPTNHLDLDALVWLEAWLKRFQGTLIVISHDREFLDAITEVTIHLATCKLTRYGGNYTSFETQRAQNLRLAAATHAKQQERITHLQKFIDQFKAKASKAKQAQSRVKALARMEKLAPIRLDSEFEFKFRPPITLPNPMLSLSSVACGYTNTNPILRGLNQSVLAGQRIGILGANGQGKSTLVKTLAQTLPILAGDFTQAKGLALGYFAQQELDILQALDSPLMHMIRLARDIGPQAREQELRDFLGSFRFAGDMVSQAVGSLSGGEKARLVLAMLIWQRPNLLLLDEPTNHLDLETRQALSVALNEFEGSVLLVSHDRALLREVCDEFWLVAKGTIESFDGDLDDYQNWLLQASRELAKAARQSGRGAFEQTPQAINKIAQGQTASHTKVSLKPCIDGGRNQRKVSAQERQRFSEQTKSLRQEAKALEAQLESLEHEKKQLEQTLECPPNKQNSQALAQTGKRLKEVQTQVLAVESRWLEVSTQLEAAFSKE